MKNKKITKLVIASALCIGAMTLSASYLCAKADSGSFSNTAKMKNDQLVLSNNVDWSNNAWNRMVFGDGKTNIKGSSKIVWLGSTPYNADNLILTNTISADKIWGSFSAGVSGGTSGLSVEAGISVSSTSDSQSFTYQVSNKWKLESEFEYNAKVSGLWLSAYFYFETSSTTQLGSSFYAQTTGESALYK